MGKQTTSSNWSVSGTLSASVSQFGVSGGAYGYNFVNKADNNTYIFVFAGAGFGLSFGLSNVKGVLSALTSLGNKILKSMESGALSQIDYTPITVTSPFSASDLDFCPGMQTSGGGSAVVGYSKTKITAGVKHKDLFLEQDVSGVGLGIGVNASAIIGTWKYIAVI
jgi:hypothetical protein